LATISKVKLDCAIDLNLLFRPGKELDKFKTKFTDFKDRHKKNKSIFKISKNKLLYQSEQLIPLKKDNRPPILFVFGNPATHSIEQGMFFSSEGKHGREHRFWKSILPKAGIYGLNFESLSVEERNANRLKALLELNYESPCRIGLCVFISLPSPASGAYSGINGIKRLLGSKGMEKLELHERKRVLKCIKDFVTPDGAVITFQKNAWNNLRNSRNNVYEILKAKNAQLTDSVVSMPEIALYGAPPTRLSGPTGNVLKQYLSRQIK
jgi:hypothetical protein